MILVKQNNDMYEIRFSYNTDIIELVKGVPGRSWNPEGKFWSIPKARLGFLIAKFKGTPFEKDLNIQSDEDINVNASIDEPNTIPDIDVSDVHWYVADGCQVFEHQKDTVKFAKWRYLNGLKSGFILADEPGCISGADYVWIKLHGDQYPKKAALAHVYNLFSQGVPLFIKSYVNSGFHYLPIAAVMNKGIQEVMTIRTTYQQITCTPDHLLLTPTGWVQAQHLVVGDELISTSGSAKIIQIPTTHRAEPVYDVTIADADTHNFVVNSFVVHNCGKTLSVCEWSMYMKEHCKAKHCLIIACVNSAKYNWREDIIKHTKGQEVPYLLGTRRKRDGSLRLDTGSKEKLEDLTSLKMYGKDKEDLPFFLIMNIEALHMKSGKHYAIADKLVELINSGEIEMIALDEVHRNCLEYDTLVDTSHGQMKIGDIVQHRLKVDVLTYDTSNNMLLYRPIIDWYANQEGHTLIELTIDSDGSRRIVRCTPDHQFYTTNRGWVSASDLTEVDDIVVDKEFYHDN